MIKSTILMLCRSAHNIYYNKKITKHDILIRLSSLFNLLTEVLFLPFVFILMILALVVWG